MDIREALDVREVVTRRLQDKHLPLRPGIHATDLVYCLRKQALRSKGHSDSPEQVMTFLRGQALHALLTTGEGEQAVEWEGIQCSPDDIVEINGERVLLEYKTTMISSAKVDPITDGWVFQGKTYCVALGLDRVVYVIMHLVGDYKERTPTIRCWDVTYTAEELAEHAEWMKSRRDVLKKFYDDDELPGVQYRIGNWECKGCDFVQFCMTELAEDVKKELM